MWDGDRLLFQADDHGNVPLLVGARPTGGAGDRASSAGDRQVTGFDLAGGTLAVVVTDAVTPPELAVLDAGHRGRCASSPSFGADFAGRVELAPPSASWPRRPTAPTSKPG